jgi:hypothetical protein
MRATVTPTEAMGKILSFNNGRFFSVRFIKKDGSLRKMTCKKVVKKAINGKGAKYNALERGYLPVYDVSKKEYRTLNFNTLTRFKLNGVDYSVTKEYSLPF